MRRERMRGNSHHQRLSMLIYVSIYLCRCICPSISLHFYLFFIYPYSYLSTYLPIHLSAFGGSEKEKKKNDLPNQHNSHTQDGTCESRCALKKSFSSMLFRVTSCVAGIDTDRMHGCVCEREH